MYTYALAAFASAALLALPVTVWGGEPLDPVFSDRFEHTDSGGDLTCPEDDAFEPNDELDTASPINPGDVTEAIVCSGNPDHYIFSGNDGDDLTITATFSHSEGDLDMQLFREGEPSPRASSSSTTDNEFISYTVASGEGGNYIVRVFGFASASNTYSLTVNTKTLTAVAPAAH